jgi:CDP-glycerol glycerophosphotransferase
MTNPTAHLEAKIAELEQRLTAYMSGQSLTQVSKIYPKTKTVVFVGAPFFGDNIKYAYLAFQEFADRNDIAVHFLTEDPAQQNLLKSFGLSYLTSTNVDHAHILLSAKVAVVYDNFTPNGPGGVIPHALLQGAKFIQLWHGIPLKEIGLKNFCSFDTMAACGPFAAFVATNASSRNDWAQRFLFAAFAPIGYPRNDVFFRDLTPADMMNIDRGALIMAQTVRKNGQAVILYAPTNRDHIGPSWFDRAGIATLADHCAMHGHLLLVNLHPSEQHAIPALQQRYPSVRFLEEGKDAYPLVKFADIVMTDYSSLAFDFLLTDRPLIFYRPDHEDYVTKARHLIPGREHYTPGYVTQTMSDLIPTLDKALQDARAPASDPFKNARQALRTELFDHIDGLAGKRVCELILQHLQA